MRLVIVSNRLPITLVRKNNSLTEQQSMGGLATGFNAFLTTRNDPWCWVGSPGPISCDEQARKACIKLQEKKYYPIVLPDNILKAFYDGLCNKTLWPLLHNFTSLAKYSPIYWDAYKKANQTFADELHKIVRPGDVVWVNDFHLCLLPALLKKRYPNIPVGFFLHTPFPENTVFENIPYEWRIAILKGLLSADLVGFHIAEYAHNFIEVVSTSLGILPIDKVGVFPMGVDVKAIQACIKSTDAQEKIKTLKAKFKRMKLILSVDRLDYTKGIITRIQSYQLFLKSNPEWRKKCVLFLVVAPSRDQLTEYASLKNEIDKLVNVVNQTWGEDDWIPIIYQYKGLEIKDLFPLYNISDVMLVTPLKDGMNLVAKEYVASNLEKKGALILSKNAGASQELAKALVVNPYSPTGIAEAIKKALSLDESAQYAYNKEMQNHLLEHDVTKWGDDFIRGILKTTRGQHHGNVKKSINQIERKFY